MQAIFLFGNGELQLNRIEFGRLIHSFCGAIDMSRDALLDLLIMLAAVDDRPAEEMTFLVGLHITPLPAQQLATGWFMDNGTWASEVCACEWTMLQFSPILQALQILCGVQLAESALQQKYAAIHTQAEETASHSTGPSASAAR